MATEQIVKKEQKHIGESMSVEKHKEGGIATLLDSFLKCKKQLYMMLGFIVRPDEIEDIVQETFVLSYTASRSQEIKHPRAFMMKVARNIAIDSIRRHEHRHSFSLDDADEAELLSEINVELQCQSDEHFLMFCRAVSQLPKNCRRVFILKKVYGLSQQEISSQLGISSSTVEKHVIKGLSLVVRHMHKHGYEQERKSLRAAKVSGND